MISKFSYETTKTVTSTCNVVLGGHDIYNLVSAMRGPDGGPRTGVGGDEQMSSKTLKRIVTTRIRAIVLTKDEVAGDYNIQPLTQVELNALKTEMSLAGSALNAHYLYHLVTAVRATYDHPIWGGLGVELQGTLNVKLPSGSYVVYSYTDCVDGAWAPPVRKSEATAPLKV